MGFFGRTKDTLEATKAGFKLGREQQRNLPETAEEMTAQMEANLARSQANVERSQRKHRLVTIGVDTLAELKSVTFTQQPKHLLANLAWTVKPVGAPPYDAQSTDTVQSALASSLVPGAQCTLKVDPDDRQSVFLLDYGPDWTPPAPPTGPPPTARPASATSPPVPGTDVVDRISQLADLHTQGLITDEEFATRKAEILSS